jgi:hypothetical protein
MKHSEQAKRIANIFDEREADNLQIDDVAIDDEAGLRAELERLGFAVTSEPRYKDVDRKHLSRYVFNVTRCRSNPGAR